MQNIIVTELNIFVQKRHPGITKKKLYCIKDGLQGGIEGDFHFGEGEKQISIISEETLDWMQRQEVKGICFAKYKANIVVKGLGNHECKVGEKLAFGTTVLEITGHGKKCVEECTRYANAMDCCLRDECCYGKVIREGDISVGDMVSFKGSEQPYDWSRYERQISIPVIGKMRQQKLEEGSALVIGAGGLGCPAIAGLAEAGVGRIGIADGDTIEATNLNRQFFYTPLDIGKEKAGCAASWVRRFRPDCAVEPFGIRLHATNAKKIIKDYDIVISAVDNIDTRMMLNSVAKELGIPLVDGAIDGFYGTVTAVTDDNAPCLACMNPEGKAPAAVSSSLGTTTMIVGALEAQYAIFYIAGIKVRAGYVLSYDGLSGTLEEIPVLKDPDCKVCGH